MLVQKLRTYLMHSWVFFVALGRIKKINGKRADKESEKFMHMYAIYKLQLPANMYTYNVFGF
jgi:hypothetical protein